MIETTNNHDVGSEDEKPEFDLIEPKKTFSRIGWALLVALVVTSVLQFLLFQIPVDPNSFWNESWSLWFVTFVPLYAVGIPLALKIIEGIPDESLEIIPADKGLLLKLIPICISIMYIGNVIGTGISQLLSNGSADNALVTYAFDDNLIRILVFVVLAPLFEELLFRKKLIDRTRRYGESTAMFLSAFTFGLFHVNFYQFFYAFGLGLVFAYIYTRTGRLRYSVMLHMFINFLGGVVAPWLIKNVGLDSTEALTAQDISMITENEAMMRALTLLGFYTLFMLLMTAIGVVLMIIQRKKLVFLPTELELPKKSRLKTVYLNSGILIYMSVCVGFMIFLLI